MINAHLSPEDLRRLDELHAELTSRMSTFVGYPCAGDLDYKPLFRFLDFTLNNLGDPFAPSTYRINTRPMEVEVIRFFADLVGAPAEDYWGYVTNGGTEGNMYGLYLAREILPDGMVYYSEDTHYSVTKILRALKMRHIMIKAQATGEIDYDDLHETLRIHRDAPPIIFANIGTTMREGIDDVRRIRRMMDDLAIPQSYIHADAALCGMTLPFIQGASAFGFDAGADSVSTSGHKLIGSPMPCGIALARKRNVDRIARSIEYVGALDTTLSGSRNGFTPLVLWYAIRALGRPGLAARVQRCIDMAKYAVDRFASIGVTATRNPNAITVVFPRPPRPVLDKWQIAVYRDIAHIITVPHVTHEMIDEMVRDIEAAAGKPGAAP
jgi:histidine decarboxylase